MLTKHFFYFINFFYMRDARVCDIALWRSAFHSVGGALQRSKIRKSAMPTAQFSFRCNAPKRGGEAHLTKLTNPPEHTANMKNIVGLPMLSVFDTDISSSKSSEAIIEGYENSHKPT